jgi:hypothetical protein
VFNPEKERLYRMAAYGIVFASGLISLPIWR